ncbi:glycosyltransferase family 4 protein [Georgenia sp. AZ-5]|uniref:glycosyltransferase family 4 protein n=1 Tax=Georgenia sp. AZ-5 TaxID=3367526 RepID=UPI0037551BD6
MRILLVTHYYAPEPGAPQHRWDALVSRFVAAGHDVAVLAPSPHYPSGRASDLSSHLRPGAVSSGAHGETVHRLHFREYGGRVAGRGLDQLVAAMDAVRVGVTRFGRRHRPDVVIATAPGLPSIPAGLALGKALRAPVVLEMRDAWPDLLGARDDWDAAVAPAPARPTTFGAFVGRTAPSVITALQRRADAVVTTTESFADVLRARGMRRVTTIRNGAHLPAGAGPVSLRRRPGNTALRVLYLGTVGRSQGLGTAVRAAALAERAGVPLQVRIVGDGAEAAAMTHLARELHAPVSVEPPVPHSEVMDLYRWADSVLVSLRGWEPLRWTVPSKLYEVLALGKHVSGVLAGEAAEILRGVDGGHVVAPGDEEALAGLWAQLHQERPLLDVGSLGTAWVQRNAHDDALAEQYLGLLAAVAHA